MELQCSQFIIRPWQPGDEDSIVRQANNRKIWRNLRDRFPHPYTMNDAKQWVQHASTEHPLTSFAIVVDGEAVGGIGLLLKDDVYRQSAEIGYWLGEAFWGRGIVSEAVRVFTDYAFANFQFCRIFAHVYEWNPGSMRVLEKAGYQFEARMRKSVFKDGQVIDEMVYAILREA